MSIQQSKATTTQPTSNGNDMNKDNLQNSTVIIDSIIERTLVTINHGLDKQVGDMTLMQAMEFMGVLMDIRDRHYLHVQSTQVCNNTCVKKPKRM